MFIPCAEGSRLVREVNRSSGILGSHPFRRRRMWWDCTGRRQRLRTTSRGVYEVRGEVGATSRAAFSLKVNSSQYGDISLEAAYQGSKVFERGPFNRSHTVEAREAKKDPRVRDSGRIVAFRFDDMDFPTKPEQRLRLAVLTCHLSSTVSRLRESRQDRYAGFTGHRVQPRKARRTARRVRWPSSVR